jgi:hypothetical protein
MFADVARFDGFVAYMGDGVLIYYGGLFFAEDLTLLAS